MLPLFDSGDDVGMVLSPQCFHNVDVSADVFNHANVQFWEYAQTGYDALDFISCTGLLLPDSTWLPVAELVVKCSNLGLQYCQAVKTLFPCAASACSFALDTQASRLCSSRCLSHHPPKS